MAAIPGKEGSMIALSIRQPWAWLIAQGHKDIENRNWPTKHRGPFLIHAGKKLDDTFRKPDEYAEFGAELLCEKNIMLPLPQQFQMGGIVGMAEITGCVKESASPWFFGEYGFELKNARTLPFLPCPGKLGFFEVDYRLPVEA
jgi:hypothetical protein